MTYVFSGVFSIARDDIVAGMRETWPDAIVKVFDRAPRWWAVGADSLPPFCGATGGTDWTAHISDRDHWFSETEDAVEDRICRGLRSFSERFAPHPFVLLNVLCWGGDCAAGGVVYQDGVVLDEVQLDTECDLKGHMEYEPTLTRLLEPLGLKLDRGYFFPLKRGAWEDPRGCFGPPHP